MRKFLLHQSGPNVDIDVFDGDGGDQSCRSKKQIDTFYQLY